MIKRTQSKVMADLAPTGAAMLVAALPLLAASSLALKLRAPGDATIYNFTGFARRF